MSLTLHAALPPFAAKLFHGACDAAATIGVANAILGVVQGVLGVIGAALSVLYFYYKWRKAKRDSEK